MKRFLLLFLGCFLVGFGVVAQQKGSEITVIESSDADQLNPYTNFSATGSYINEYLYYSLIRTDKNDHSFVPLLAADLPEVTAGGSRYTYTLNPGAKWNSGKPITARDVIFSMKMIKNPFLNNANKRIHYTDIVLVLAEGDNKVSFQLKGGSPQGLRITGEFAILSEDYFDPDHSLEDISWGDLADANGLDASVKKTLIKTATKLNEYGTSASNWDVKSSCGPYLIESWTPGKEIVLLYNKKFWGRKLAETPNMFFSQNFERIRFSILSNEAEIRKMVFAGKADLVTSLPASSFGEMSEIPKLQNLYDFYHPRGASYEYIGMNMRGTETGRKGFFENVLVRKGLAHVMQVDYLLGAVQYGLGRRICSDYPYNHPDYINKDLEPIDYNLDNARALLAAAGWADTDGDGVLDKDGEPFEVEIVYNTNRPARKRIAGYFAKQARLVGVTVKVSGLSWPDYLSRLKKRDYDLMVGAWVSDPNEDSYSQIWHSKNIGTGSNWVGYGDADSDRLIEAYDTQQSAEERKTTALQIQAAIYQAQPYIFLWSSDQCIVVSRRFERVETYPVRPGFWLGDWQAPAP